MNTLFIAGSMMHYSVFSGIGYVIIGICAIIIVALAALLAVTLKKARKIDQRNIELESKLDALKKEVDEICYKKDAQRTA